MRVPVRRAGGAMRPYLPIALLGPIFAFVGYWATYYGKVFAGTVDTPPTIQIHAAIFVGWLLLVVAQASLAATGRIAWHVRVGNFGFLYGAGVVAFGVFAVLWSFQAHLQAAN